MNDEVDTMLISKVSIFYYPELNLFKTVDDKTILCLEPLVSPDRVFLFKHGKKTMEFISEKYGVVVRMLYPLGKES